MVFFYGPLYLEVILFELLPEEYRAASFPGDDSRMVFRIQHSSWFNNGYMFASVYEAFWKNFTRFLLDMTANCGTLWRTGRFPWSCSENHRDSPAVH